MKINHSTIHPCIHPFIDRSRRAIDRVGRSPIGRRPRDRNGDGDGNGCARATATATATANGADDEACVRRGLGDGRVRDDRVRRWSSVGRHDDASSSSSQSSSGSSFVRALDVETLRDDVIARSRDPWVISFSGSRERCGMCGTMDDAFARAAKSRRDGWRPVKLALGRDGGERRCRGVGTNGGVDDDTGGEGVSDARDVESVRRETEREDAEDV